MRVTVSIEAYNGRRYGKPWIGVITAWPADHRPELRWGQYLGNDDGGDLEIEAAVNDIIRWGQRDYRGNNTANRWEIVCSDGSLIETTEARAREHWMTGQTIQSIAGDNVEPDDILQVLHQAQGGEKS